MSGARGLEEQNRIEVTVDGEPVDLSTVQLGSTIELRVPIAAGPRDIGVAFYRNPPVLV